MISACRKLGLCSSVLQSGPMKLTATIRTFTAWIACLAILMAALAPSISHALVAVKGANSGWVEVCSVAGTKLAKLADSNNPASSPAEKAMHSEHCPYCFTHAVSLALLPSPALIFPLVNASFPLPSLFYQSSSPLFAWASAQPRAPPAIA